jgi:predicted transcriptional regulator of viral defense system
VKIKNMNELLQIFKSNKGYLSSRELTSRTMRNHLQKLIDHGKAFRIKRGVYCLNEEISRRQMIDVERIVPDGVICIYSAWSYYQLSLTIPNAIHLAVEKSRKISLPNHPKIRLTYIKKEYYEMGIETINIEGFKVKIYDIEKSVCDAVKYRNKVGMELTSEVLKNYLALKNRNIDKLIKYAKAMRVYPTLKIYLEVQL